MQIRAYKIGNAPRPKAGDLIRVPFNGEIVRARALSVQGDTVDVDMAAAHVAYAEWSGRMIRDAATPDVCECGSGSNLRGPGHSDWCKLWSGS